MLIKTKDDVAPAISRLEQLLKTPGLLKNQRDTIENEIIMMRSGAKGERDAAHHIEFELQGTNNYAIIHDLRIEHNNRVAQIDHLLINRYLDIFVIESKNFSTSIRINDLDEFEVRTRFGWRGIPSPVEQNKRHAEVLKQLLNDAGILPKRLGFQLTPTIYNWVLVSPECNISGRSADHDILKMDMFGARMKKFREQDLSLLEIMKLISSESLTELAKKLASFHNPISIDYSAKFGVVQSEAKDDCKYQPPPNYNGHTSTPATSVIQEKSNCCEACGDAVEEKTVSFCRLNKKRLGGKLLCRKCQAPSSSTARCDECGTPVDSKVVAFCRFSSRKFGKRTLCRDCQNSAVVIA